MESNKCAQISFTLTRLMNGAWMTKKKKCRNNFSFLLSYFFFFVGNFFFLSKRFEYNKWTRVYTTSFLDVAFERDEFEKFAFIGFKRNCRDRRRSSTCFIDYPSSLWLRFHSVHFVIDWRETANLHFRFLGHLLSSTDANRSC